MNDKIRARLDDVPWDAPGAAARFMAYEEALRAVLALHRAYGTNILGQPVCATCVPLTPVPCATVRAIADALGVTDD